MLLSLLSLGLFPEGSLLLFLLDPRGFSFLLLFLLLDVQPIILDQFHFMFVGELEFLDGSVLEVSDEFFFVGVGFDLLSGDADNQEWEFLRFADFEQWVFVGPLGLAVQAEGEALAFDAAEQGEADRAQVATCADSELFERVCLEESLFGWFFHLSGLFCISIFLHALVLFLILLFTFLLSLLLCFFLLELLLLGLLSLLLRLEQGLLLLQLLLLQEFGFLLFLLPLLLELLLGLGPLQLLLLLPLKPFGLSSSFFLRCLGWRLSRSLHRCRTRSLSRIGIDSLLKNRQLLIGNTLNRDFHRVEARTPQGSQSLEVVVGVEGDDVFLFVLEAEHEEGGVHAQQVADVVDDRGFVQFAAWWVLQSAPTSNDCDHFIQMDGYLGSKIYKHQLCYKWAHPTEFLMKGQLNRKGSRGLGIGQRAG